MSCEVKWALNKMLKTEDKNLPIMSVMEVKKTGAFHKNIPQYQVTPLADLKNMAEYLGLAKTCVKDENCWFGLGVSKALGGSYAITRYITRETKRDVSQMPYSVLTSKELRDGFGQTTFFSTTDGDHGRGIAWTANRLGQKYVIRMPAGSTENRCRHIGNEGTEYTTEKVNYDDCVRMVAEEAKHAECDVVIQDTAWEGYEEIPFWIMQGCSTMADKAVEQFGERPTHVFVQTGVGSLVRGMVRYFANKYKKDPPVIVVMEAEPTACLYRDAETADGEIRIVDGEVPTIMVGLCYGEPDITSWDILKDHVTAFLAVNDDVARRDMHVLAVPFKGDPQMVSGESSAATLGALATIMKDESYRELCLGLGPDQNSKVLIFSTEGDTDPDRYRTII